ncbi:MAG: DEAD/DEAH box helicase family protein [Treponema sp.]|jgi:KaiC/GvpD/RAD55 family RecA-like ATPase|nr:DEAD/DEAH box helicase family protein [Treponema sp.]
MTTEDLIQRSPIRIFEQSIHGGLKGGEIGIIAAPNGIGKTSVLVQIALYKLLQSHKVIHVSFIRHTDHVLSWYEDIFDEFTKKKSLDHANEVKNSLVKNRVLMNFNQEGMTHDQILKSLRSLIVEGGFKAESLIIDGFDFSLAHAELFKAVKQFAAELELSVWYSCSIREGAYDNRKIPLVFKEHSGVIDVVITLEQKSSYIELFVSKDRNVYNPSSTPLKLDPKTLLVLEA